MTHVTDDIRWQRITSLFDQLLAAPDSASALAAEADPAIRQAAEELWMHHLRASENDFLGSGLEFSLLPVFKPQQMLLNRFRIEKLLGSGGMGEVYLAQDCSMKERVALKTVTRLLAPSPSVRRRIAAEVQSARRVTHPNVCRIHDLFEDGDTVFFTMEYLEGRLLSEMMEQPLDPTLAKVITRQLAEGLRAAHKTGVVHGDLKPGNVMVLPGEAPRVVIMDFGLARALDSAAPAVDDDQKLSIRAGTVDFMAPELHAGSAPTVRSDVFAFGKIAHLLLPQERLWEDCTRARVEERPESIDAILRRMDRRIMRRWLIGATGMAAAGVVGYSIFKPKFLGFSIPEGARIMVNGFRAVTGASSSARLARSLMLTALRQSPRIRTVTDQDLLPALARMQPDARLPLAGAMLERLLNSVRAKYWIEADLVQKSDQYSIRMQVLRAPNQVIAETSFRDLPGVIAVARQAALWVRSSSGESQQSLAVNPVTVGSYTSTVPEALQKYYDALEHYSHAKMELAIPLLEEAVRLDPEFAQAHHQLAVCLNPMGRHEECYKEIEKAKHLAAKLPERERVAIETSYFALTEDTTQMLRNAFRSVDFYPDEPRGYRLLARTLSFSGAAADGVQYNRKALDLTSGDDMQRADLIDTMCEAGQFSEAVAEYEGALKSGIRSRWLHGGGGFAYLGAGRYDDALAAYEKEPGGSFRTADLQRVRVLKGELESSIATSRELVAAADNPADKHHAQEILCALYFLTDRPEMARPYVRAMADLPVYPQLARHLDCTASWAGRLGDRPALTMARERLSEIAARWPSNYTNGVEKHARGLEAWLDGSLGDAESLLAASSGAAFSVWALLDLASLYIALSKPAVAEDYFERFDQHRGTLLAFWCTGTMVLGWGKRAAAAQARNDRAMARMYSKKVLDHWGASNPGLKIVQSAAGIYQAKQ